MGDVDHLFVHRVGVLSRRHPHGLSRLPVAGCEGKRGLVECYIGVGDTSDRHCHVPNRLGIQDDGVGVEVSLFYLERCVGDRHPGSVVVRHGDRHTAGGQAIVFGVVTRTDGVRDVDHLFVDGVVVLHSRYLHLLRRFPVAGGEGERGLVEG